MLDTFSKAYANRRYPHEKMQESKRQSRYTYRDGPMVFLGQQIVKAMQDAGYPAKLQETYRDPHRQNDLFHKRRSKARAWQSPHQFLEAVDIVHPAKFWDVSDDYWDTLYAVTEIVEQKYNVTFEKGYDWGWDKAHIELKDWRTIRDNIERETTRGANPMRPPTPKELWQRFKDVLPAVAKQHMRSPSFNEPTA